MLKIEVNGKPLSIEANTKLDELLENLGYQSRYVAVAKNFNCVSRSHYSQETIKEGDKIEILSPMVGG